MIPEFVQTRKLFTRTVVPAILRWLDDRQAIVLVGSRQVGTYKPQQILDRLLLGQHILIGLLSIVSVALQIVCSCC